MIVCVARASVSRSAPSSLRRELPVEPFRRKLDRRQRILDLVSEAARDLAPRGVALRLHEIRSRRRTRRRSRPRGHRQARAAHQQRAHEVRHRELGLLLPLRVAARAKAFRDELGERRERGKLASPVRERRCRSAPPAAAAGSPPRSRSRCAADTDRRTRARLPTGCRGCSRDTRAWFRWRGATPRSSAAPRQLRGHRVERLGQHAELVARSHRLTAREIALRDGARAFGEQPERRRRSAPTARRRARART